MARRRFFVDRVEDGRAELVGEEAHHLARVLRAETGQQYELSDGHSLYLAEIREADWSRVRFEIVHALEAPKSLRTVVLYLALIKFDRFEWAIEKATELGASAIVPVECARSEAGLRAASVKRSERWRKIARESSQQSRRVTVPEIREARKPAQLNFSGLGCRLEEQAQGRTLLRDLFAGWAEGEAAHLLVGPEGGWTEGERAGLDAAGWQRASLGSLVLRAETAAMAALAVACQYSNAGEQ